MQCLRYVAAGIAIAMAVVLGGLLALYALMTAAEATQNVLGLTERGGAIIFVLYFVGVVGGGIGATICAESRNA